MHFDGKFTWNAALGLVETLDTVIETYRYDAVELVVTSPGGDTDALAHVLTSLRERQANGVMFQTRVVSYAASAAAVLATAGDFRTAAEGAKLLFHGVRSGQGEAMTARVARAVAQQVERINHVLLDNMVGGVLLAAPCPPPAAIAQPGDRPVLEALWPIVSPKRRARRPRALQALVEATCAYVGRAVAAEKTSGRSNASTVACCRWRSLSPPISRRRSDSSTGWAQRRVGSLRKPTSLE